MRIDIKNLTDRQREAWIMRYRYGWKLRQIALAMGIKKNTVSELLVRGMIRAGLPKRTYVRIMRTKFRPGPRVFLSDSRNARLERD